MMEQIIYKHNQHETTVTWVLAVTNSKFGPLPSTNMSTKQNKIYLIIDCFQPVPYRSQLQEKIEPGQTLIIKGSTIEESQRYE